MGRNVVIIGTLDTKGPEIAYLRDRLLDLGMTTTVVDSGILGEPLGIKPDIEVQYKRIEKGDLSARDEGLTKEKDLKNHLEAEPDRDHQDQTESEDRPDSDAEPEIDAPEGQFGLLNLETLQSDYQVVRALDILLSYDIFKGLKS